MVEQDLPALRAFAPDEGKDAVILFGFAFGGTLQVKVAGNYGKLGRAAGTGEQADLEIAEGERRPSAREWCRPCCSAPGWGRSPCARWRR